METPPAPSPRLPIARETSTLSSPNPMSDPHPPPSSWRKPAPTVTANPAIPHYNNPLRYDESRRPPGRRGVRAGAGAGARAIKSHPQSPEPRRSPRGSPHPQPRTRSPAPAAPHPQPRTRSDPPRSSPSPQPSGAATTCNPIRHPGERRHPRSRRTRRYRAVITRSATMGPGVRRDDGGWGRERDKVTPAEPEPRRSPRGSPDPQPLDSR